MNTDQITPVVRRWLRHTEATPPDAHRSARQVMARMPYVRQRGRWWPLPLLGRRTSSAPSTPDREQRFAAIPDTTYRIPTVTGRTRLMFSPVKAIVAGALVFALGGVFLIAQPFDQGGSAPGAEQAAEPLAPVAVTGAQTSELDHSWGWTVEEDGVHHTEGPWWTVTWEADDPRLSGQGTWASNFNWLLEDGPGIHTSAYVLVNPDGRWVGTGQGYGDGIAEHTFVVLRGEDGYDGLTATLLMRGDAASIGFEGLIFPFEPPEVPVPIEPPADE